MRKPNAKLRALQIEWYDRLAKEGFRDAEKFKGNELVLVEESSRFIKNSDEFTREIQAEYFRLLCKMINDEETVFKNGVDKHVLTRYSEGAQIKTIVHELTICGTPRERRALRFIIRRYEMSWKIRTYNRSQLNLKRHG